MLAQHLRFFAHAPQSARAPILSALALASCGLTGLGCAPDTSRPESAETLSESAQALSCPKAIPASLAVPSGAHLAFSLEGVGTQNYVCKQAADGSYAWTFVEPDATLYGWFGRIAGHHFAGPTWEANDGSSVAATKLAAETVDATAVPWLLLKASAHTGQGLLTPVTYVQRLETIGGLAPTSGCDAAHTGATADIRYAAKYSFYR